MIPPPEDSVGKQRLRLLKHLLGVLPSSLLRLFRAQAYIFINPSPNRGTSGKRLLPAVVASFVSGNRTGFFVRPAYTSSFGRRRRYLIKIQSADVTSCSFPISWLAGRNEISFLTSFIEYGSPRRICQKHAACSADSARTRDRAMAQVEICTLSLGNCLLSRFGFPRGLVVCRDEAECGGILILLCGDTN